MTSLGSHSSGGETGSGQDLSVETIPANLDGETKEKPYEEELATNTRLPVACPFTTVPVPDDLIESKAFLHSIVRSRFH